MCCLKVMVLFDFRQVKLLALMSYNNLRQLHMLDHQEGSLHHKLLKLLQNISD